MTLKEMITAARVHLRDLAMKRWKDAEMVDAANEGKDELCKWIRQARRDFFQTTATITIPVATPPAMSEVTLPSDFSQLKNIQVTDDGHEWINFIWMDQSDPRFIDAKRMGGQFSEGGSTFFYDIAGKSKLLLAPPADVEMSATMTYNKTVPDMVFPTDEPTDIPSEHHNYIVTYIICECMRGTGDPEIPLFLKKLEDQKQTIMEAVVNTQVKESEYVVGYMEQEYW